MKIKLYKKSEWRKSRICDSLQLINKKANKANDNNWEKKQPYKPSLFLSSFFDSNVIILFLNSSDIWIAIDKNEKF